MSSHLFLLIGIPLVVVAQEMQEPVDEETSHLAKKGKAVKG